MFEFVRSHTRLLQFLLLILILPSFVVFGIQGYSSFTSGGNLTVAKVAGQTITQAEWDASHQQQTQRARQQMPNIDPKLLDSPQAHAETLEALIRERVLLTATDKLHLAVSNERMQRLFITDPQFAMLRNPDNTINKEMLAAQGMTLGSFEARLRQDLSLQQVQGGITGSVLAANAPVAQALDAWLQRREVQLARFDAKDYVAKVVPTDAEIEAFYKAHEADFRAPERLFALLLQAAGRAGRDADLSRDHPCEMWVQTYHPAHPLFESLKQHDFAGFAAQQLTERSQAGLPPFSFQALLRAEARTQEAAQAFLNAANDSGQSWLQAQSLSVTIYPAVPMSLQRVANVERAQMLVESHSRRALQLFLSHWQNELQNLRSQHKAVIRWAMDVDPLVI